MYRAGVLTSWVDRRESDKLKKFCTHYGASGDNTDCQGRSLPVHVRAQSPSLLFFIFSLRVIRRNQIRAVALTAGDVKTAPIMASRHLHFSTNCQWFAVKWTTIFFFLDNSLGESVSVKYVSKQTKHRSVTTNCFVVSKAYYLLYCFPKTQIVFPRNPGWHQQLNLKDKQ